MSTTQDHRTGPDETGHAPRGWARSVRWTQRYGRFVGVAVLLVTVAVMFRDPDTGDEDDSAGMARVDRDALVRSGPLTPEQVELLGDRLDWAEFGPGCDPDTGRIRIPTAYAPPCVPPFGGDNGGATSPGVTGETIKVIAYIPRDDLITSAVANADIPLDPTSTIETLQDYVDLYNRTFETYGRQVELVPYRGTGSADDQALAKADAIAIAEREPFAVVGGPSLASETFADELAARGVLCLQGCALGLSTEFVEERAPYVWPDGMTPAQAGRLTAEAVGKLAGPGPATLAGDPQTRRQDRVYGVLRTDEDDGQETYAALRDGLADYDIEIETTIAFSLEPARAQEAARNIVVSLEEAGVTTVVYTGDMLTPQWLTEEATAQDYHPEWILGPNYFADTAAFGRTYDQEQWVNGFGLAFKATATTSAGHAAGVYDWAFGEEPSSPITGAIEPAVRTLFTGVHLAGAELTPETFRDGLFRFPRSGDARSSATVSWGDHGIWPGVDYGDSDDVAILWWDPRASDEAATGIVGPGLYRLANEGQRYPLGELPASPDEAGLFDDRSSALMYGVPPPEDQTSEYTPPR